MCSLVSRRVRLLYITSPFSFLLLTQVLMFWSHQWDSNHSLNHLWLKYFMGSLGRYLVSLSCKSLSSFYYAFVVLCLVPWLLALYNVSISMYFVTYTKFNTHTIVMLENLLNAKSFGGFIDHLIHHQATIPVFSGKLSLPSIV